VIVVLVILSVVLLGAIIYFAISPKSSRLLRLASVIALGLVALSLLVSGFFIIKGPSEEEATIPFQLFSDTPPPAKSNFRLFDIGVLVFFLGIIGFVIAKAMRDQKKAQKEVKIYKPKEPVEDSGALEEKADDSLDFGQTIDDDESFDIGLD
jgi:hypothetical protein